MVTLLNGRNSAIRDTDQSGMLAKADPILYGLAAHKPRMVVGVASLENGVMRGLGGSVSGIFCNSYYGFKQFHKTGA